MTRMLGAGGLALASLATGCVGGPPSDGIGAVEQGVLSLPATELQSGQSFTTVGSRGQPVPYGISVAAPSRLMFDLTGGTDPQLFLARGRIPTSVDYDIRLGFGFPLLNLQTEVDAGEWYLGVRDVNLDYPFPADPFTLTTTLQPAGGAPPLAHDLSAAGRRETSNVDGQLQYFTVDAPQGWGIVDVATTERFGSGQVALFAAFGQYPRVAGPMVVDYTWASSAPGLRQRIRAITPGAGKVVTALYGPQAPGYENVILTHTETSIALTTLESNRDVKVSGAGPQHFVINVPPGQARLVLTAAGGKGASHLSASSAGPIVASSIYPEVVAELVAVDDPNKPNDATITIQNPAAGEYFLLLEPDGLAGYTDVTVRARYIKQ